MTITGYSLIGGVSSQDRATEFHSLNPATGEHGPVAFHAASAGEVESAARSAAAAFDGFRVLSPALRAEFLERCATNIAGLGDELVQMASSETGLAAPRIGGERDRTVNQFRFFAKLVRDGSWVDAVIDHGDPTRVPIPRPDLRRMRVPLGPVAVFGASNFPLAYSAGGGDTASALAAGCPVVVKGHPSHPGTGELVAAAISRAVGESRLHPGTYGYLHAGGARELDVGKELITHPDIRAAGFTGSLRGGMALARLGASRPDPIPVYSEMGSVNPVFVLDGAVAKDSGGLAQRLHASVTNSTGQMCTCPGLIFVVRSPAADEFVRRLGELIAGTDAMVMLSPKIRASYVARLSEMVSVQGVRETRGGEHSSHAEPGRKDAPRGAFGRPTLLSVSLDVFRRDHTLREECFGPATVVVMCETGDELIEAALLIDGSLTGTICMDAASGADRDRSAKLHHVLERRVGRLIYNGVPTGVEVAPAMVHGGPYPSTNQPHTSAVGSLALERWCRPVCYQNCPEELLPDQLKESNPLSIRRTVNGKPT